MFCIIRHDNVGLLTDLSPVYTSAVHGGSAFRHAPRRTCQLRRSSVDYVGNLTAQASWYNKSIPIQHIKAVLVPLLCARNWNVIVGTSWPARRSYAQNQLRTVLIKFSWWLEMDHVHSPPQRRSPCKERHRPGVRDDNA